MKKGLYLKRRDNTLSGKGNASQVSLEEIDRTAVSPSHAREPGAKQLDLGKRTEILLLEVHRAKGVGPSAKLDQRMIRIIDFANVEEHNELNNIYILLEEGKFLKKDIEIINAYINLYSDKVSGLIFID